MNLNDVLFVTHGNCLDGSTSAILFLAAGGKRENLYFCSPSPSATADKMQDLRGRNKPILFVDLSIPLDLAQNIDTMNEDIFVMDHHTSAVELDKFDWCKIDTKNERCGAQLFYDWLLEKDFHHKYNKLVQYKNLVKVADDYDRWIWNSTSTLGISTLFRVLGQSLFIDRFLSDSSIDLTAQEQYVIQVEQRKKEEFVQRRAKEAVFYTKMIDGDNIKFAVAECPYEYRNDLADELCRPDLANDVDFVMLLVGKGVSLRARKGNDKVDVSHFAELNGGGGHKSSAACSLANVLGNDLVELVVDKFKFEGGVNENT